MAKAKLFQNSESIPEQFKKNLRSKKLSYNCHINFYNWYVTIIGLFFFSNFLLK